MQLQRFQIPIQALCQRKTRYNMQHSIRVLCTLYIAHSITPRGITIYAHLDYSPCQMTKAVRYARYRQFQGSSKQETGDTADSNYTRCAAGLVLDIGTHWADQICKNSSKNCAAGPLEPPQSFTRDYSPSQPTQHAQCLFSIIPLLGSRIRFQGYPRVNRTGLGTYY